MKCLICLQSETVDGLTCVAFSRGEFRLTVSGVPARVCPGCGEAYVAQDVAQKLLALAERESAEGMWESALEFNE